MNEKLALLYDFAFRLAEISYQNDDVPVGAVVYKDDTYEVVAPGFNQMKLNTKLKKPSTTEGFQF